MAIAKFFDSKFLDAYAQILSCIPRLRPPCRSNDRITAVSTLWRSRSARSFAFALSRHSGGEYFGRQLATAAIMPRTAGGLATQNER